MALASRNVTSTKKNMGGSENMSVVIPAAGMGYRMKSYGPKALTQLTKKTTLIDRQIQIIKGLYPKSEIVVVVGFEYEKIIEKTKKYNIRIVINPIHDKTNVLYSTGLGIQACTSREIMIIYGDLIFNEYAIKGIRGPKSRAVVDDSQQMRRDEVGLNVLKDGEISNFAYGLENKWCQIAYLHGIELSIFEELSLKKERSQWLGYEGLNHVIENGGEIFSHKPKNMSIVEIDVIKDLEKIQKNIDIWVV